MRGHLVFCAVLIAVVTIGSASGQSYYTLVSPSDEFYGNFGYTVSGAGDVNSDGYDDLIVGAVQEDENPSTVQGAGRAYVYSGETGELMYTLLSPSPHTNGYFGKSVSGAGDVNSDGYDDVIVGASNEDPGASPQWAGRAYVFSGQTMTLLYTLMSPNEEYEGVFGWSVSGGGDQNLDGYSDVVVGAIGESPGASPADAGRAYVFSGQTGLLMRTFASPNEESYAWFGFSVSSDADVNLDGRDDVIVGAPFEDPGASPEGAGRAYVYSGLTGSVLRTLASPNEHANGVFGWSVSGAGDVNSDGYDDVIVGAFGESPGASPDSAGRAYVYSGLTGVLLHTLVSPNEELDGRFGSAVSGAGDVNSDGYDDVIVGAHYEDPGASPGEAGRAYVFNGLTGALLHTLSSPNEQYYGWFGYSVSGAGNPNLDWWDDVIVGAYWENPGGSPAGAGRAYVFMPLADLILWGNVFGPQMELGWTGYLGASAYWVYGAGNMAYFHPGLTSPYTHRVAVLPPGATAWSSNMGVGDTDFNMTYMVIAVDGGGVELARSNRFGEHDFGTATPP